MKTYYTRGTIGDTYIILCKLYSVAKKEKILCRHYTHERLKPVIKEIYSLLPNIHIEFINAINQIYIKGAFHYPGYEIEQNEYNLKPEYYPEFELGSIERFNLPKSYEVLQTIAGNRQNRKMSMEVIEEILASTKLPMVFIGEIDERINRNKDVCRCTSIKQDINIIRNSKHFYGTQGFLSYVAVSQRVQSTVFVNSKSQLEINGLRTRIEAVEEWRRFLIRK